MAHDIVADALNQIMNTKKSGKQELEIKKHSKFLVNILEIAKKEGYIDSFKINEEEKVLHIKIGKLNKCKAIKPRFFVKIEDIEKYMRRYLPSRNFGIIIISTSSGLVTHHEAYEKDIGGSLIAYFY